MAAAITEENRIVDMEIPACFNEYIDNIHSRYIVFPTAPLTMDPDACESLTDEALRRNLAAHAEVNPDIVATGTRKEMVERLRALLELRRQDLVVSELVIGEEDDDM